MRVKVGIVGVENTTVTMFLHKNDEEVKNFTKQNWHSVAFAIVRRKLAPAQVFPIHISAPEWHDSLPERSKVAAQHTEKSDVNVESRKRRVKGGAK